MDALHIMSAQLRLCLVLWEQTLRIAAPKLVFRMRSRDMLGLCRNSSRAATSAAVLCVLCSPLAAADALLDGVEPAELSSLCSSLRCSHCNGSPAGAHLIVRDNISNDGQPCCRVLV